MKKYRSKSALKHLVLTTILAGMCQHGAAQATETVATGLMGPAGLHIIGENLYVTETNENKISKIVLATETKTDQYAGGITLSSPTGLASIGNVLYIAVSGLVSLEGQVLQKT